MNHLLFHCLNAYELWSTVWTLFGLLWVMPHSVYDLFSSWRGSFSGHWRIDLWRDTPHCVLWCIWSSSYNLFLVLIFLEMFDLCNLCLMYCYPCTPPVYLDFWLIQFRYLSIYIYIYKTIFDDDHIRYNESKFQIMEKTLMTKLDYFSNF